MIGRATSFWFGGRAWSSYGWREEDILRPSQFGRSVNPNSIEGFFPGLSTVGSTYSGDLCLEGFLGLSYANIVDMLLDLIFFFLGVNLAFSTTAFAFFA